jgi:hypothetical protein
MASQMTKRAAISLRKFLQSEDGIRVVAELRALSPGIALGDSHVMHFSAGKKEGWANAIDKLEALADPSPESPQAIESDPSLGS